MFEINLDEKHAIIEFVLEGVVREDEMELFVHMLRQATLQLRGREIKIKADLRGIIVETVAENGKPVTRSFWPTSGRRSSRSPRMDRMRSTPATTPTCSTRR